ncbi:MAG: glycosyltransferase, partial [Candidatus Brocadiia bacterium]|nr:glycosyltransferase [Candidatus Brocadiia bacterium]
MVHRYPGLRAHLARDLAQGAGAGARAPDERAWEETLKATRANAGAELRVAFAGGGTGGHIMPAAAVAEALGELVPGARCLFLGTSRLAEARCR